MSKKDYQAIARALHFTRTSARADLPPVAIAMWQRTCEDLASTLASNPKFDRARFIQACETGTCKGMPKK